MPRPRFPSALRAVALLIAAAAGCVPLGPEGSGCAEIARAYADRRSDVVVECAGEVVRVLADDTQGSQHQRFILELSGGQTVLVSHNIDLAPRVEGLRVGDRIAFRGEYAFNDRGGVIHWTHHDPGGRRPGGWLERDSRRYR